MNRNVVAAEQCEARRAAAVTAHGIWADSPAASTPAWGALAHHGSGPAASK